jgi:hypothetical protein
MTKDERQHMAKVIDLAKWKANRPKEADDVRMIASNRLFSGLDEALEWLKEVNEKHKRKGEPWDNKY